ncbi:hypothetical protein ACJIZ3_018652 [Penstemon smallii]|uniref:Uncharacterized protein n=1 Tax=Penstemon smallii TaxID=265156 RepID=A0ABD3SZ09_9LAMI
MSSADLDASFPPGDMVPDSDQGSFAHKGTNNEYISSEESLIEIDEAKFSSRKTRSGPKPATSTMNVEDIRKKKSRAYLRRLISPADARCGSDQRRLDKSSSLTGKGNNKKYRSSQEFTIDGNDILDFRHEKLPSSYKIGSSTRQGLHGGSSAATFQKTADFVEEEGKDVSSEYADSDSGIGQTDKSSSFTEKEEFGIERTDDEDMDSEEYKIERIDEAEFRNKRTHFMSNIGVSSRQDLNGEYSASTSDNIMSKKTSSTEIDKNRKKRAGSAYSRRKKNEKWIHDNVNAFLQDEKISSYGQGVETNLGIASRTRSKMTNKKKSPEVDKVSPDLSHESSSSADNGSDSSDGDDFELENSYLDNYEVQKNIMMGVSAKNSEDCHKKEGNAVKHASKRRCFPNPNNEKGKNCYLPAAFRRQNFSCRKQKKGGRSCERNELLEENDTILGDNPNAKEGLKKRSNGKRKSLPKFSYSKQSYTQKDSRAAVVVNELQSKNQSRAGIRRHKNAVSPSHSEDEDISHSDDDVQRKFDTTSPDILDHGKNEKLPADDETEKQTKGQAVSSTHYDFYKMLANSVLEKGPVLEKKGSEIKETPATQSTLPLKFRFEDEVPKQVEKTEYEKEMEGLFDELDLNWELDQMGLFNYSEVHQEHENYPSEEAQDAQCARGKHELVLQDDTGLRCIYCLHVEIEPRDILPEWVENNCRGAGRKRSSKVEDLSRFNDLPLASSADKVSDFNNSDNGTVWNVKPGIKESMYKHQQEGFEFLWMNLAGSIKLSELTISDPGEVGGCIISHAPGTGKTRLTIVFIETYLKLFPNCRPVIIAPAGMLLTWEEEFKKWNVDFTFHNLNNPEFMGKENKNALAILAGSKRPNKDTIRMVKIYSWNTGGSILGISYSLFAKLAGEKHIEETENKKRKRDIVHEKTEAIRKILLEKPGLVVLDEGHTARNRRSNIWNTLLKLQTGKRVILSGTPFQNNFGELFNTMRVVRPVIANSLAKEKTFAEMITSTSRRKNKGRNSQSASIPEVSDNAVEELKIAMSPFVHVHKGSILQESLPGLRDCVILLKPPPLQKCLIETIEGNQSTFEYEHKVALISVHPYLIKKSDSTEKQSLGIELDGAMEASKLNPNEGVKTKFIVELVRLSMAMREKVLIFSQYIQPLELIKEQLNEIFKWVDGKQILRMEGKLEQKQRQTLINKFNDPLSEAKVMLASIRCSSEGISLVGASRVVLLDVVWNPSVEWQAICRAYRIGQKKFVYTYHLLTSGTSEGDKYCRQAEKGRLSELVFSDSSDERNKQKSHVALTEDRILDEMVGHSRLKEMFEKIINQPKETDLIQSFGLTS